MMYTNRSDSKTTFNSMPIVTRNYMFDNSFNSKYITNRNNNTNSNSNLSSFFPPLAKSIQLDQIKVNPSNNSLKQSMSFRIPPNNGNQLQQTQKSQQLPQIFTYFPKSKPYTQEDQLVKYDLSLFDSRIFKKLKFNDFKSNADGIELVKLNGKEYVFNLGDNLILRSLKADDYDRDYLQVLEQLTIVGDDVDKEKFEEKFFQMKSCQNTYYILVIEDTLLNKVIASTTLIIEQKFIRHAAPRGHIEDVVVDDEYRGRRLGSLMIDFAVELGRILGCYKISLDCNDKLKRFYEKFDFKSEDKQNYLCKRF